MSQTCTLTGIILNTMPVGEYDRRVSILTRERGKVSAFMRGARRPKSPLQAAANLFCFGSFEAYEGRTSYTIVRASVQNYFRELTADLELTYYGCYFLELADYFCQENMDCSDQLKLLYQTLRALTVPSLAHSLVRCIYEWKSLTCHGIYPEVFSCIRCGAREQLHFFSMEKRGVLCESCAGAAGVDPLNDAALYALQYIIATPVERLYTFTVTQEVLKQLENVVHRYLSLYVDRELKTLHFLT